jgi:hypothetical protein
VSETRERLRWTFDRAAHLHEAARPSYPTELFDDLVELAELEPGDRLLEVGCATGKATRPLLERGFSVVCVEMGAQLAERARHNLAGLPVEIHIEPFETWEVDAETFDVVYAATATWRSGVLCTRSLRASIPSSARFRRSTTQSARATPASGLRPGRKRSKTTEQKSTRARSSRVPKSDATSGKPRTRQRSTSGSSTPSQATSRWNLRNASICTARSVGGSASVAIQESAVTGMRSSTLLADRAPHSDVNGEATNSSLAASSLSG